MQMNIYDMIFLLTYRKTERERKKKVSLIRVTVSRGTYRVET